MQRLVLLSIIASANAAAVLDILAEPCTGSGTPKAELANGIVGICFGGGASVLSVSEQAVLQVKSYDTTTGEGTIRVDAEGMQTIHCPPATFKKLNNEAPITVDLSACGKIHKAIADVKYCSDQHTLLVHVKVPDTAAPGASSLPHVPVTLKPTTCKAAKTDLKAAKAA